MEIKILLLCFFCLHTGAMSQFYENKRCRCVCPSLTSIINRPYKTDRTLFIAYVPPNQCNCDVVILPRVSVFLRDNAQIFCPRCECKYEIRNTAIIMVVVIFVIWISLLLSGYLIFYLILEIIMTRKGVDLYRVELVDDARNPLMQAYELEDHL